MDVAQIVFEDPYIALHLAIGGLVSFSCLGLGILSDRELLVLEVPLYTHICKADL